MASLKTIFSKLLRSLPLFWLKDQLRHVQESNLHVMFQNHEIQKSQKRLARQLEDMAEKQMATAKELIAQLVQEASDNKTATQSALLLMSTLTNSLNNALDAGDMATLRALVTEFDTSSKQLASAVVANTVAENEPVDNTPVSPVVTPTPVVEPAAPVPGVNTPETPAPTPDPVVDTPAPATPADPSTPTTDGTATS